MLVWSYVIKWMALAVAISAYLIFILSGSNRRPGISTKARAGQESLDNPAKQDDGFDFLRNKKHLKNRADMIITGKTGGESKS